MIRPHEALTLRHLLVFRTEEVDTAQSDSLTEHANEFDELVMT